MQPPEAIYSTRKEHFSMYRNIRKILILFLFALSVWFSVQFFLPLFLPFLLGGALALAAEPMVSFLNRRLPRGLSSGIGVTGAFLFLALVFLLILALIVRELAILAGMVPNLAEAANIGISALSGWALGLVARLPSGLQDILTRNVNEFFSGSSALLDEAFRYVLSFTGGILRHVPDSALVMGTSILSGYMISARLPRIKKWLKARVSREKLNKFFASAAGMKTAVLGWMKAQFKLMGITWVILLLSFVLLRIPYAPMIASLIALVDAFPVLGTGTVLIPWSLVCFLQEDTGRAIGLLGCYSVISLSRSILEPRLVGSHLGLDPLAALAAIYAGYKLWGLGGLIAAPILAVLALQIIHPQPQGK